jgi:alpha-L-rhamnosidase
MMRKFRSVATLIAVACLQPVAYSSPSNSLTVVALRTEHASNPVGIDIAAPRLSWQIHLARRGARQSAYQIRVASSEAGLLAEQSLLWDSGKVVSDQSILRPYGGTAAKSTQRYYWQVRVWDEHDVVSSWSNPAFWEMALLSPAEWKASWISPVASVGAIPNGPAPLLRKTIGLRRAVRNARIYVTSHGLYEIYLNGKRVGNDLFTPGWTSYNKRLQYQTYDVTDLLRKGPNGVGVTLADGWYRGYAWADPSHYGDRLAALVQIHVTYEDGSQETLGSDSSWKSSTGPILKSEIYAGEDYDARMEKLGWASAGFDDRKWSKVDVLQANNQVLVAQDGPRVRRMEEITPVRVFTTPAGETVVDFGQNMVGWVRLKVKGAAGTTVVLRHAEVLDSNGNFYTENLRTAKAEVRYTLSGRGAEVFEPHFTFQGFRYVAISGYPGNLTAQSLTGVVIYSDMPRTSTLETSDDLINRLYHNILWGQKGNFLDVPTDCPQRDERMGWTADAQVFSVTAADNMDVAGFFRKWLADLAADQDTDGRVPFVIPDAIYPPDHKTDAGAAGWSDAATVIPWNLYREYGDVRFLQEQYESMKRWVEYERSRAGASYIWQGDYQFGDWLDFFTTETHRNEGSTSPDMIATAYFAHSTDILRQTAQLLGKQEDAAAYGQLFDHIRTAFQARFVKPDGTVAEGFQTAYVLALDFDLLPEIMRDASAAKLAQDVGARGHLTTGFLGTPHLLEVLTRYGYLNEAYKLFEREQFPSWLYPVKHDATTIWERWDGIKPDGSFEDASMNSFNHYAYGAVGEWIYQVMVGIKLDPAAPGYQHVFIEPQPGGHLNWVKGSHDTPYGPVATSWSIANGTLSVSVEVPPNTHATVRLPHARLEQVMESGAPLSKVRGVTNPHQEDSSVVAEVSSGSYSFDYHSEVVN